MIAGIAKKFPTPEDFSMTPTTENCEQELRTLSFIMRRMKIAQLTLALLLFALCSLASAQQDNNESCLTHAKTQLQLARCSNADFAKADGDLNRIYRELMQKLNNDPKAATALRDSQRAWLRYRDAHLKALHPHPGQEGSSAPACHASQATQLTRNRVEVLEKMLNPQEGDVCAYRPVVD